MGKKIFKMVPGKGLARVDEEEFYPYHEPSHWYGANEILDKLFNKGYAGIYWIRLVNKVVSYPKGKSAVIYIGSSKNIRQRLKRHFEGRDSAGRCIRKAVSGDLNALEVGFEAIPDEWSKEEKNLLKGFEVRYGALPKCNSKL